MKGKKQKGAKCPRCSSRKLGKPYLIKSHFGLKQVQRCGNCGEKVEYQPEVF